MKKLQTPALLSNLYRDMRDRRMLVPALALVVALIAVPALLGTSSSSAPPLTAATGGGKAAATEPAVVTEQLGVTQYRKRLDHLSSKNPFRRHFTALPKSAKLSTTSPSATSATTGGDTGATTSSSSSSSFSGTVSSSGASLSGPATTPSQTGGSSGGASSKPPPHRWYSFRVSVAVGPAGKLTKWDNVKRLTFLPGKNRPLFSFAGVTENGHHATFVISHDVSSVRGDGQCVPRRGACDYLELRPGDKASVTYAPQHDRRFNLKLRQIKLVNVARPQSAGSGKVGSPLVLGPDG
jgi:hypothetical protein